MPVLRPLLRPGVFLTLVLTLTLAACIEQGTGSPGSAQNGAGDAKTLILRWTELNGLCRGGSGDNPATLQACEDRDVLGSQLEAQGFCYGENDEFGFQADWAVCSREFQG